MSRLVEAKQKTYRILKIDDIGIPGSVIEPYTLYVVQRKTWFGWFTAQFKGQVEWSSQKDAQTVIDVKTGKIKKQAREIIQPSNI